MMMKMMILDTVKEQRTTQTPMEPVATVTTDNSPMGICHSVSVKWRVYL